MKTVTICGSMKFMKDMQRIAFELETKQDMNVLQCVYNIENQKVSEKEITSLEKSHFRKIDLSDAIYVIDIQGYIGNSVSKEIEYAKAKGKEIILHSEVQFE